MAWSRQMMCAAGWLLIACLLLGASATSTHPTTRPDLAVWLDLSVREAARIPDQVLQAQAYAKLAGFEVLLGDVTEYRRLIGMAERALSRAPTQPAKSPIAETVDAATIPLLHAMARHGEVSQAKALADQRTKGREPFRPGYYGAIASGQVDAGDLKGALDTAQAFDEYDRQTVLSSIVGELVLRADFRQAQRVAQMMTPGQVAQRTALQNMARGMARRGQYESALAIAGQLKSPTDKQEVYQNVVHAQAEKGDYAAALETAATVPLGEKLAWPHPGPEYGRSVAYADIARTQLKRKDIVGALSSATLIEGDLKAYVLSEIAMAQIAAGDLSGAGQTADAIPPLTEGLIGDPPQAEVNRALACALARNGNMAEAVKVAKRLPSNPQTLLEIAQIAATTGRREEARRLIRELKSDTQPSTFFALNPAAAALRIAYIEKLLGNSEAYDRYLSELKRRVADEGRGRDETSDVVQLFSLYAAQGDLDHARQLAGRIPADLKRLMIPAMASQSAQEGHSDRTRDLAGLMPTAEERATLLAQVIAARNKTVPSDDQIRRQIEQLPSDYDQSIAYLSHAEQAWRESQQDVEDSK